MTKQMAIMRRVGFGCRDVGTPVLWFEAYISDATAALQVLSVDDAVKLIEAYGAYDVKNLEGKPCWVETDNLMIKYLGPCKA